MRPWRLCTAIVEPTFTAGTRFVREERALADYFETTAAASGDAKAAAAALGWALGKPVVGVHHLEGHFALE